MAKPLGKIRSYYDVMDREAADMAPPPAYTLEEPTPEEKRMFAEEQRVADKLGMSAQDVRDLDLRNVGGVNIPPSMLLPVSAQQRRAQARSAKGFEVPIERLREPVDMPETVPSLSMPSGVPTKTSDFASLQKFMSPGGLTSPIPVASASVTKDAAAPVAAVVPSTGPQTPAGKPDSMGASGLPAPSSEGAGGDALSRLGLGQALVRALEGSGSVIAGRDLRSGAAETLGERMKQIEALRAKREERQEGLAVERAQNEQTLNAYQAQFPELREALENLRGQTGKPAFQGLLRDIVATRRAKTGERALDLREQGMQDTAAYRAGTLGLRRDIAEDTKQWRAVQAGLKQAEIDLRRAEGERKAVGGTEPSEKERNAFQASMKPAERTAVALRDADTLNSLSGGMLVTGKPPEYLSRADIAAFNGFPLGQASRTALAQSNPQAFDLLTKMAEIKTIIGHEYFGSALSPAEAERQRQFMDFGVMDSPESIAKKMKNYHDTLKNSASVFLRPRVVGRPLGAEWTQTALGDIVAPGGTFAGLLDEGKKEKPATAKTTPIAPFAKKEPSVRSVQALKDDPSDMARQEFDEEFGAGAAKKALGE